MSGCWVTLLALYVDQFDGFNLKKWAHDAKIDGLIKWPIMRIFDVAERP